MKGKIAYSLSVVIGILLFNLINSAENIKISNYEYRTSKAENKITIVHLSDLHNHVFGSENKRLIAEIEKLKPDFVMMTGDMVDHKDDNTDIVCDLVESVSEIAPVYYSYGNHEDIYSKSKVPENNLRERLEAAGAVVLEMEYEDIELKGTKLRIGGNYNYALKNSEQWRFLEKFTATDRLKILMQHMPETILKQEWDNDLILAGHTHGGAIRLPFIGGVFSPNRKLFPEYDGGLYQENNQTMIVSKGLGMSIIPRLFNRSEIGVISVIPENREDKTYE